MTQGKRLREILKQPGILVLPGVYDCIGAKLIEKLGFSVVFTSGFGISGSTLGRPDYDALIVRSRTPLPAAALAKASRLQVIGRAGVGLDGVA